MLGHSSTQIVSQVMDRLDAMKKLEELKKSAGDPYPLKVTSQHSFASEADDV
jgi:hypothetical protein